VARFAAIAYTGATPVFVDAEYWTMDQVGTTTGRLREGLVTPAKTPS
jgi:hypothetical protein